MKVVPQDPKSYGEFYTGDSYIILHVRMLVCYISFIFSLNLIITIYSNDAFKKKKHSCDGIGPIIVHYYTSCKFL